MQEPYCHAVIFRIAVPSQPPRGQKSTTIYIYTDTVLGLLFGVCPMPSGIMLGSQMEKTEKSESGICPHDSTHTGA